MVFNGPPHAVLVDFWYGGLNYQIEHHLFPTMPRNKLRQARPLVKAFCSTVRGKQEAALLRDPKLLCATYLMLIG